MPRGNPTRRDITPADVARWPNINGQHGYTANEVQRFLAKVDARDADECWPWTGGAISRRRTLPLGYGLLYREVGSPAYAHRISYALANASGLGELFACHTCDNSICCNPAHLFAGTPAENAADMVAKGRKPKVSPRPLTAEESRRLADRVAAGQTITAVAEATGLSRDTVAAHVRKARELAR